MFLLIVSSPWRLFGHIEESGIWLLHLRRLYLSQQRLECCFSLLSYGYGVTVPSSPLQCKAVIH